MYQMIFKMNQLLGGSAGTPMLLPNGYLTVWFDDEVWDLLELIFLTINIFGFIYIEFIFLSIFLSIIPIQKI